MRKMISFLVMFGLMTTSVACGTDDSQSETTIIPETPEEPSTDGDGNTAEQGKTLIVYYSFTNNTHTIATELQRQITADAVRIEPAEKGIDYAANNYAVGSNLIAAIRENPGSVSSYPTIDEVSVNLTDYDNIVIAAPLWWSNMAAPLQTYLFQYGTEMAGKNIFLIVSSASSGISGVESDAKRLIPDGVFKEPSLWIRSSQTSNSSTLIAEWLQKVGLN